MQQYMWRWSELPAPQSTAITVTPYLLLHVMPQILTVTGTGELLGSKCCVIKLASLLLRATTLAAAAAASDSMRCINSRSAGKQVLR